MIYMCEEGEDYEGRWVVAASTDYSLVKEFAENLAIEREFKLVGQDHWRGDMEFIRITQCEDLKDIK